jgi:PAS domain S-box-containing protein
MSEVTSDSGILDEKLCSTLVHSIHGIIWEADPLTFQFSFVSPHAERILGYSIQQWINEPDFWLTHTHPDDVAWYSDYCREASLKGEDHEFQYRMIAADGRIVWLHDIVTVVRSHDGTVRLRGIMFDITERKEAEDALRASEERLRVIFDTSHSGIIMINPDGNISFANKRMAEMFSCTLPELIGSPYLNRLHPEELQANNNLLEQLMNRESDNGATERHYLRCDGSYFWGYVASTRLKTASGTPQALIAVVTDITDYKTQQLALLEETARWQMMMERSRDGIVILDVASNAVRDVNPAFAEMLGYTRNEMSGMHPWDWDIRFTKHEIEAIADEITKGEIFFETRMRRKDGMIRDVEVSSTITEFSGEHQFFCICRDITERKRAKDELAFKNAILSTQQETSIDGILVVDENNTIISFNRRFVDLWEIPHELVEAGDDTPVLDFIANRAADTEKFMTRVKYLYEHKDEKCREEVFHKDGRVFERYSSPALGPEGKYFGRIWYFRDITERKRAEDALLESSQFCSQIISSAEEGIIVYDRDMRYQVWNPFMEKLSGKKASEVIGTHPLESFPWLHETGAIENIQKVLAGQSLASIEFLQTAHDGQPRRISDTCVPLRSRKGEIIGVIGTVIDITERKQAEEVLKEATQRLQLAVSSGHLGIWDWDAVNDVLVWNERMYELYGVSKNTFRMSRETWIKCLHPDDVAMGLEEMRAALNGEKEYDFEFRIVHPDGETKFIKSNAMVMRDEAGKAVRVIGMNMDITERKHTEEQLRQAQKMEAVGQLAGGVAHDFNNILTAIYGYCSLLQIKMGDDSPFRSDIDHIYAAAEKAANLTRSLLAFSRKQIMSPKKVNLNEIVMNVAKLLTRIIGEDIQLKAVCKGAPLRVFADSGQIEQILMNLAANARDAMPNGGTLTIETGEEEIDESFIHAYGYGDVGIYVALSVSDTGKGMDNETRKKIFEPFFTTKEVGKGTGLGLSIVYGVIKQHNGYINVYSEPNEGTTFRIYLPQVYEEDANAEKGPAPEHPRMGSETVLLAEDDETIRELAGSILRQYGYDVILAHDGEDAVEKFKANKEKIAVIVMDMIMPRKSGKEAYEKIRKVRSDVKIIFMSGYSPDLLHDRGIFADGGEVLIKPIHPLELVRKVRAVLDSGFRE